ncbi:hypothetical protein ABZ609_34970, partial [Streptomyces rubiginosohelvolus]
RAIRPPTATARSGTPAEALYCSEDAWITTTVDVRPWLPQKLAAILAHRSEVERGAAPGRIAALTPAVQREVLGTEWYIREDLGRRGGSATELSA